MLGLALVAAAVVAYVAALTTGLFAVRTVSVAGTDAKLAADVRAALADAVGDSLVGVDVPALQRRVEALPTVASAGFDRAFPHELAVTVVPERPVAVLRRGADSWLVSARGRVMEVLPHGARLALPRIWLGAGAPLSPGDTVAGDAAAAVRAVAPLAGSRLALRVRSVRATRQELTLILASGLEVRLGDAAQVPLKLAVTAAVAPRLDDAVGYLDVAVPERPVAGSSADPQAGVESQASTNG